MKFSTYEVKKTTVQALQVTADNMQEVCDLVGSGIGWTVNPVLRTVPFIKLDKARARSGKTSRGYIDGWLVKDMVVPDRWHYYTDDEFRRKYIVPEEDL